MMRPDDEQSTHFGFREVPADAKAGMVRDLFAGVADKYDLMNDAMSFGAHRIWKTALIDWLAPRPGQIILDLAGGTGDVAIRILRRSPETELTVLDLTQEMVAAGQRRAEAAGCGASIDWIVGDALNMPFTEGSFDACTIGFGIRNFTDIRRGLAEIHRILKTGGRLMVLEFSDVRNFGLRQIYDRYSFRCIPELGHWIARDRDSYSYLVESIRRFPDKLHFTAMIKDAGFANVKFRSLLMGIAALHSGWKI